MQRPQASSHKKARWAQGVHRHQSPCPTMTQSCRPSGPTLTSILLTMLLGGEWGHMSIHLSLSLHSCLSTVSSTCVASSPSWGGDD